MKPLYSAVPDLETGGGKKMQSGAFALRKNREKSMIFEKRNNAKKRALPMLRSARLFVQ